MNQNQKCNTYMLLSPQLSSRLYNLIHSNIFQQVYPASLVQPLLHGLSSNHRAYQQRLIIDNDIVICVWSLRQTWAIIGTATKPTKPNHPLTPHITVLYTLTRYILDQKYQNKKNVRNATFYLLLQFQPSHRVVATNNNDAALHCCRPLFQ